MVIHSLGTSFFFFAYKPFNACILSMFADVSDSLYNLNSLRPSTQTSPNRKTICKRKRKRSRDLTQSYNKNPYTHRKIQKAT